MKAQVMRHEMACSRTSGHPQIAYTQCGAGDETVIFLHGIGGNKDNWSEQLSYFAGEGYRAVAWDVRGYGDSDDYEGDFLFDEVSADLLRLMDELGAERAHLVGLSMGGRILMDFAWRYGARVQSLTMCGSFPSFGKALSQAQREDYLRLRREPLLAGRSLQQLAPELIASLAGPDVQADVYDALHASICRLRPQSYLKALEAAVYFDRTEEIRLISRPTLLLYAENDRLTPPQMGQEVQAMMPKARLQVLPRCGHLMNLEVSALFNEVVHAFICNEVKSE
ncbi:alpha/beta hydrolase [Pusillimonas sp. CC-YST705]|uniref:Alpha/beta hydrolase n=1 Tax=Mesopusillimonas faecipullorum TaxID=2755040 RepID=A0ABS8CE17_9BURK|nr:alpha/beta hydrolase [Mesopusillimonas faecipullorum]MCB5364285.1 alpha/beta hydrolase [Mesopusillimonas faecipullorum]